MVTCTKSSKRAKKSVWWRLGENTTIRKSRQRVSRRRRWARNQRRWHLASTAKKLCEVSSKSAKEFRGGKRRRICIQASSCMSRQHSPRKYEQTVMQGVNLPVARTQRPFGSETSMVDYFLPVVTSRNRCARVRINRPSR